MAKAKPMKNLDAQAPNRVNAQMIVQARLAELAEWSAFVDEPYRIHELHNLRIAAKRLRYTLEVFADVLPEDAAPPLKEIEQLQEELGALHDSDVMIALLRLLRGSEESGEGYEQALARTSQVHGGAFVVNPALLSALLDPAMAPSAEQRQGLELFLAHLQRTREEQYNVFRKHFSMFTEWIEKGKQVAEQLATR